MKKHLCIAAAASLAVGTYALAQDTAAPAQDSAAPAAQQDDRNVLERTGDRIGEATERTKDALTGDRAQSPNAEEIHDVLAQVAESAFTKEGLDDMVERFVDADRNRLGENQDALKNNEELDGRIAQLQQDWKDKYGQEFDIKEEDKIYGTFAMVSEGEIGEGARPAGGIDVDANVDTDAGRADVKVDNETGVNVPRADTTGDTPADRNLDDPGRNIATINIAESHGLPALNFRMIHEAGGWKIDVPDHVDANKLRDNVQTVLTMAGENKDKWPGTVDEGYRAMTHKVLCAVLDQMPTEGAKEGAQPGQPGLQSDQPGAQPQ